MNRRRHANAVCCGVAAALAGLLGSAIPVAAETVPYTSFTKVGDEYRLTLPTNPIFYYGFQHSNDLRHYAMQQMAMGSPGPTFGYTPAAQEFRAFFRARRISVAEPEDWDNDYLDDVWEIQHPYLNPLDPNDAFQPSPEPDAGGRNNLDYYRWKRGIIALKEAISREASIFNFGEPTARLEAISREASVFNFGSPPANVEAISPELSVFNGEGGPPTSNLAEVYSREVSIFNFDVPPGEVHSVDAISQEVSVFNGEGPPTSSIAEVYSREVSTFNFGQPSAGVEAISREVSVLNTAAP
jgi:hypothetical protein